MENEISNNYIENAINELNNCFGVKERILGRRIRSRIKKDKIKEAIKLIAQQIGLPIDVNLSIVPKDYRTQNSCNQFQGTSIAKVSQTGSGSEGITAQVQIPGSLPFYGSSALNGYPINVKISDNCTKHPAVFAMIMAHELSHVLLYSLHHTQKKNEFYTDLTAIMHGLQYIFKNGRKITNTVIEHGKLYSTKRKHTINYGYLNDNQFNFACDKIYSILKKNKERKGVLSKRINEFRELLLNYENSWVKFKQFLDKLTKNTNKKIKSEDAKRISKFFKPGYMNELESTLYKYKDKQSKIDKFCKELSHYTEQRMKQVEIYIKDLNDCYETLKTKFIPLRANVEIMTKIFSLKYKIKVFLFYLFKRDKK